MEDKISQSFKVQWLNETLKFVKNDNQLTMDYPEMPMAHVEYFYNLIWQRQDHIGLGFKTLYAPLWDAMSAFSVKYEFQISVAKSESVGQLIIKKIPRTDHDTKKPLVSQKAGEQDKPPKQDTIQMIPKFRSPKLENLLKQDTVNRLPKNASEKSEIPIVQDTVKKFPKCTSANCDKSIIKKDNEEAPKDPPVAENCEKFTKKKENEKARPSTIQKCENPTSEVKLNATVQNKPKKLTKSQKYCVQTRKIIDSIAPGFFKTNFLKIYEFLNDESIASVIFSDLAPSEAQFLQNFLAIYNRRAVFDVMFSPFCNDLLNKMGVLFKEFDKKLKLDICVGKTDVKTSKREIMFLKVPRYTQNNTTTKAKLTNNTKTNEKSTSDNVTDSSGNKLLKALNKTPYSTSETNTNVITTNSAMDNMDDEKESALKCNTIGTGAIESVVITKSDQHASSPKNDKNDFKTQENQTVNTSSTDNIENRHLKQIEKNEAKTIDNEDVTENSDVIKTIDRETIEDNVFAKAIKKVIERKVNIDSNESTNDSKSIKITVSNTKQKNSNNSVDKLRSLHMKDIIKKPTKKNIIFEKATDRKHNESVTDKNINKEIKGMCRFKKNKLLFEAMSTPVESDRAVRMMRLMGWEGGALGLRGEGITEPIIPAINITPGAGLGHVSTKSQKKQDKLENRLQLLYAILDLLTSNGVEIDLLCNNDLTRKEKRAFSEIIHLVNLKKMLTLSKKGESDLCQKIHDKMANGNVKLEIIYHTNRKIALKKNNDVDVKETDTDNTIKQEKKTKVSTTLSIDSKVIMVPKKKTVFRILVLNALTKFLKQDETRTLNLEFNTSLCTKYRAFVCKICKSVNNRDILTQKKFPYHDIIFYLYKNITDDYLDLYYGVDFQTLTITKVKEYPDTFRTSSKNVKIQKNVLKNNLNGKPTDISVDDISETSNDTTDYENKETDKKDETKDNNNNCNTKSVAAKIKTNVPTSNAKEDKSLIILVEIENCLYKSEICELIAKKIKQEINFLPYLKNHGLQNGYLVYSCYNAKSCLWLKKVTSELDLNTIEHGNYNSKFVLRMKINVCMTLKKILSILDVYNPDLNSADWELLRPYNEESMDFIVKVNYDSFKYVRDNNFRLHTGFDEIEFLIDIRF